MPRTDNNQTLAHDEQLSVELIQGGAELAGAAAGAAIGLIEGPGGAVAGAGAGVVLTRALKRVGADLQVRLLGPRQRVRVGAAFTYAAEEIRHRLESGESPTIAWEGDGASRPESEEVLEGILLAAADAWEEKRVRHLGVAVCGARV